MTDCKRCVELESILKEMAESATAALMDVAAKTEREFSKHRLRVKTLELEITALKSENQRLKKEGE